MKYLKSLVLGFAVTLLASGCAKYHETGEPGYTYVDGTEARISDPARRDIWVADNTVIDISEPDGADVFIDMPFRVIGMAGTIAGTAFFIGTSPLTALASAFPPHNAFEKSAETFVMEPVRWTFQRPVGVGPTMPGMSNDHVYGHYESRKTWNR